MFKALVIVALEAPDVPAVKAEPLFNPVKDCDKASVPLAIFCNVEDVLAAALVAEAVVLAAALVAEAVVLAAAPVDAVVVAAPNVLEAHPDKAFAAAPIIK